MMPGHMEWIIVLIIALLIFGPRLPKVMRSLGQSVHEFKEGMEESTAGFASDAEEENEDSSELAG